MLASSGSAAISLPGKGTAPGLGFVGIMQITLVNEDDQPLLPPPTPPGEEIPVSLSSPAPNTAPKAPAKADAATTVVPEKNAVKLARIGLKVVQLDEDDYQAHRSEIDAAVQKGDVAPLSDLKSSHLFFDYPILTKAGERGVMEHVSVFPYPIAFAKDASGKITPTDFTKQYLGVRFVHFPTFTDGKINLKGDLNITSLEKWTQTEENPHKPIFHVREAPVSESFVSGQTKGFEVPGGAQMEPFDPMVVYNPDTPSNASKNPKALRRIFFFLNAQAYHEDDTKSLSVNK
jgi:hypothetical protein